MTKTLAALFSLLVMTAQAQSGGDMIPAPQEFGENSLLSQQAPARSAQLQRALECGAMRTACGEIDAFEVSVLFASLRYGAGPELKPIPMGVFMTYDECSKVMMKLVDDKSSRVKHAFCRPGFVKVPWSPSMGWSKP